MATVVDTAPGIKYSIIPKKNKKKIYEYVFKEGVIVVKKDPNALSHPDIDVPNLHVLMTLRSLKSRDIVDEQYNWQHHYYFLKNEGIEKLRQYLHLPAAVSPATLTRLKPQRPRDDVDDGGQKRFEGGGGGGRGFSRGRGYGDRGGFGREGGGGFSRGGGFNRESGGFGREGGGFGREGGGGFGREGGGFGREGGGGFGREGGGFSREGGGGFGREGGGGFGRDNGGFDRMNRSGGFGDRGAQ